ncbi:hypothetical protein ACIREE_08135 [Streptomyces sp. NPDC102467]|uniref:WXG100-like domain-containing protein n=1 Tax=Streptomyces sp. NPDC102467 TaxID=3366179 RepID=UPI00381CD56C
MSSAADKAKEILQDVTGMWWPAADEDGLRDAAQAWRDFADDIEDVTAAANKTARGIITHNKGVAISAFDDPFWRRYYYDGRGWLQDMIDGARDMAKALDQFADTVHKAVKHLEHELEIIGATIIAGTALAIFTFGISEAAAAAATAAIVELSATLGVTVSTEIATIVGTTLTTAAIGSIESVTVDLAVSQPLSIALGESKGISLDELGKSAAFGAAGGGAAGAIGGTVKTLSGAGRGLGTAAEDVAASGGRAVVPDELGTELDDIVTHAPPRVSQGDAPAPTPPRPVTPDDIPAPRTSLDDAPAPTPPRPATPDEAPASPRPTQLDDAPAPAPESPRAPEPTRLDDAGADGPPRLTRQDDDFAATHSKFGGGLRKSHFDPDRGLVPADPEGSTTPLQHVLGGKNKAAKESSPYTSFAPENGTGKVYGKEEIQVDYKRLQQDIDAGKVEGVKILAPKDVQGSIGDEINKAAGRDIDVPGNLQPDKVQEFVDDLALSKAKSRKVTDRIVALLNTRRDGEWLIGGVVPKEYVTGPHPTAGS